jgi:hypothetical protein
MKQSAEELSCVNAHVKLELANGSHLMIALRG